MTTIHTDISADQPFTFTALSLAEGELITAITVMFKNVPDGFGLGNEMVFTFKVTSDPGTTEIINKANMSYTIDGKTNSIDDPGVPLGPLPDPENTPDSNPNQPQTGIESNAAVYLGVLISALFLMFLCIMGKKRKGFASQPEVQPVTANTSPPIVLRKNLKHERSRGGFSRNSRS